MYNGYSHAYDMTDPDSHPHLDRIGPQVSLLSTGVARRKTSKESKYEG